MNSPKYQMYSSKGMNDFTLFNFLDSKASSMLKYTFENKPFEYRMLKTQVLIILIQLNTHFRTRLKKFLQA